MASTELYNQVKKDLAHLRRMLANKEALMRELEIERKWGIPFKDLIVKRGKWAIAWTYIGESTTGDFDMHNEESRPLLRAELSYDGKSVVDGSYCTNATTRTPRFELRKTAMALLKTFDPPRPTADYDKVDKAWRLPTQQRKMEIWTHLLYSK